MTITIDWQNKIIQSTASITDLPVFHAALRDLEDNASGMIYPVTHTWKALDLGSGAMFYQADLINGYVLKFIGSGPFQISGNLNGTIVDTGVQIERKTSAAFATTAVGGSGPSAESIAAAVRSNLSIELDQLTEAWARLGLDPSRPVVQNNTQISFGSVLLALSEAGSTVIVARQ